MRDIGVDGLKLEVSIAPEFPHHAEGRRVHRMIRRNIGNIRIVRQIRQRFGRNRIGSASQHAERPQMMPAPLRHCIEVALLRGVLVLDDDFYQSIRIFARKGWRQFPVLPKAKARRCEQRHPNCKILLGHMPR